MKCEERAEDLPIQEEGDFLRNCLPKSYNYFKIQNNIESKPCNGYDAFDNFIKNEIKVFSFLIEEYYKQNCPAEMQLIAFADEKQLSHFDNMIFDYLNNKTIENAYKIRELYIYMLESKVLKMIKNSNKTKNK